MFRFTIRDVLWLTVVVALGVGWWLNNWGTRMVLQATRDELSATRVFLCESGGVAEYRDGKWIVGDSHRNYWVAGDHSALP